MVTTIYMSVGLATPRREDASGTVLRTAHPRLCHIIKNLRYNSLTLKPIPEDTGSFLKIRTANPQMLYVDKTAYLHRLISSGRSCLFLARPRRFGKSLMITTLKEIFNGRKDLFEGLVIAQTDYEWKKHPVLHFNFGQCADATGYENFANSFAVRITAVSDSILEVNESAPNPIAVMYLEGYLTRTGYDPRSKMYRLGIPNEIIRQELRKRYSVIRAARTSSS